MHRQLFLMFYIQMLQIYLCTEASEPTHEIFIIYIFRF